MSVSLVGALSMRLSGLRDAMHYSSTHTALRDELGACVPASGGVVVYRSLADRPPEAAWRAEWIAVANGVADVLSAHLAAEESAAGVGSPRAKLARAMLRRWDAHTSCVDLAWDLVEAR